MGASDYRGDDQIGSGLNTGTYRPPTQQAIQQAAIDRQNTENLMVVAGVGLGVLIVVCALQVVMHRRKIAAAADAAVVAGLATGVRASRKVASKKDALIARVLAKADAEKPPQA